MRADRVLKTCDSCGHQAEVRRTRKTWFFRCSACGVRLVIPGLGQRRGKPVLPEVEAKKRRLCLIYALEQAMVEPSDQR